MTTVVLALGLAVAGGLPSQAAGSPTANPTPPTSTDRPTLQPQAPTIGDVGDRDVNVVSLGGTGTPGATLRVLDPSVPSRSLCEVTVAAGTTASAPWSCTVTLPNGAGIRLTVRDVTNSGAVTDGQSTPFSVLGPPTVVGGTLVGSKLTGRGEPGAVVSIAGGASTVTASVDDSGSWSTVLSRESFASGSYSLTATQASEAVPAVPSSARSAPATVTVDHDAPPAPTLVSPRGGDLLDSQPVSFRGTGEEGSTVTVYVDSSPVCQSVVTQGSWQCTSSGSSIPDGSRAVQAGAVDAAGNFGSPSPAVSVTLATGLAPAAPPASEASATPTPAAPSDEDAGAAPSPAPPTPPGGGPADDGSGGPTGQAPGSEDADGDGSAALPDRGTWATATTFGRDLPTIAQSLSGSGWMLALGLAVAFVLLIVGPARLTTAALRDRLPGRRARFTGRNRTVEPPTSFNVGTLDPRLVVSLTVLVGAVVIAVAAGVDDQLQYARLFAGIVVGLIVLNGVCIALPAWITARLTRRRAELRVSPRLLLAAVVACGLSRALSLDPPVVLGVLVVGSVVLARTDGGHRRVDEPGEREHGVLAVAQLGSLIALAGLAWIGHSAVPATGGFWTELGSEALATMCLAGFGSLVVAVLPVGTLPGRHLWAWSRGTYLAVTVLGVGAAAALFTTRPDTVFPVVGTITVAVVLAVLALAAWLWVRYVEGELDRG